MKIASYFNFLKNLRPSAKNFFFYGSNTELTELRIHFLKKKMQQIHRVKFRQHDIDDITNAATPLMASLFENITQNKTIYFYNSNALKSFEQFDASYQSFADFLIWRASSVYFQSPLVKAIDKHPELASIANYHLEADELQFYIKQTLQAEAITYDTETLQYLIDFHEHDLASLPSNLENLVLHALDNKQITINNVKDICQNLNNEDIKACALAFIKGDIPEFLHTLVNLGDLVIMIIPLTRFISRILQSSLQTGSSPYQKSKHQLSFEQVAIIINGLLNIEQQIKSTGLIYSAELQYQLKALMPGQS